MITTALAALAAVRLGYETWRYFLQPGPRGAMDLRIVWRLSASWFDGRNVYILSDYATHPPATFALMWPFVGWLPWTAAHWLWAVVMAGSLAALMILGLRAAGLTNRRERRVAALLVLAMAPTAITVGIGETTFLQLAALLAALALLRARPPGWGRDLLVALALLVTLIRPHFAAPLFWVFLFSPGGFRPVALSAAGYLVATGVALSFQHGSATVTLSEWFTNLSRTAATHGGHVNLHAWLQGIGLEEWTLLASLVVLIATGLWVYRRRHVDPWFLVGATAIVARLWTYHEMYDDILMVLPLIALCRVARIESGAAGAPGTGPTRALLVAGATLVLLPVSPIRYDVVEVVWDVVFVTVWLGLLAFLVYRGPRGEGGHHLSAA